MWLHCEWVGGAKIDPTLLILPFEERFQNHGLTLTLSPFSAIWLVLFEGMTSGRKARCSFLITDPFRRSNSRLPSVMIPRDHIILLNDPKYVCTKALPFFQNIYKDGLKISLNAADGFLKQWDSSTATPMEEVCELQGGQFWKINFIWSYSMRVSQSANELFCRP